MYRIYYPCMNEKIHDFTAKYLEEEERDREDEEHSLSGFGTFGRLTHVLMLVFG